MSHPDPDVLTIARLEAIAAVRFIAAGRHEAVDYLIRQTDEPVLLAKTAIEMAHALLITAVPESRWQAVLDGLTAAAVDQADQ